MPYHRLRDPERLHQLLDAVLVVESDLELPGMLRRIAESACAITGARYGALGVLDPSGKSLAEFVHVGMDPATAAAIGHLPDGRGILGLLILDPRAVRLDELADHPNAVGFPAGHPQMHSFLGVPVRVHDEVFGNLYLTEKEGGCAFTEDDETLVVALAAAAGIAITNARLHARVAELGLAADRERIARDLHDTVIQRLFATGLSLQSAMPLAHDAQLRERVEAAIDDLDDIISQVRTTIFALEPPPGSEKGTRARVLEICADAGRSLGFDPEVRFVGPIDAHVTGHVATELLSTLREALSNVARHARAGRVEVELTVTDAVTLAVTDDGVGVDGARDPDRDGQARHHAGHGLPNMAARAEALGGEFVARSRPGGGTQISWSVPLQPARGG